MSNTQVLLAAASVIVTLIVAFWGITATYVNRVIDQSDRNTTRMIEQFEKRMSDNANQFEKRMNEHDEKLPAKIDALRAEMAGEFKAVNVRLDALDVRMSKVETQVTQLVFFEKRIDMLERRAA
jgi:predicted component of type VI protein secretion system